MSSSTTEINVYAMSDSESVSHSGISGTSGTSVDFFTKFNLHRGWKSLLLFQFQPQFSFTIVLAVIFAYSITLLDAAYALGTFRLRWIEKNYDRMSIHLLYSFDLIYFIDLISMTIYKHVDWTDVKYRHKPRNSFLLFIEYLTLIPLDGIYYTLTEPNMRILYILRLRYAVRIFRLMGFYKKGRNYVGTNSHILQLFIIVFYVIMFVITASAVAYVYYCQMLNVRCIFNNEEYFSNLLYTCLSKIVMIGQLSDSDLQILNLNKLMFYVASVAYVCNVHLISQFVCDVIHLTHKKYTLIIHHERLKLVIKRLVEYSHGNPHNMDKYMNAVSSIYNLLWVKRKGIRKEDVVCSYLPEIKYRELDLDMAWYALQHSHIFRTESVSYLRYISKDVVHVSYSPGEVIYKKNERKTKMIYIISGVVQVFSEDDNETPIVSFSEGTCLGESTIFISYPSSSSVVCKDFCELAILRKKYYIKTSMIYPQQNRVALQSVLRRYKNARMYNELATLQKKEINCANEELNMQWLKYVLRKLLGIQTLKSDKAFLNKIENITFCYKYLDLMVIAKEFELVTDSIFLKTTFPYIFKPRSIVLTAWDRFICIVFLYFSIVYPYYVAAAYVVPISYIVTHIIVSILWYIDLYIAASTSVKQGEHFYTTIRNIVTYKFSTTIFVLNFLSALNPGFLLYMMVPTVSLREILLVEMPKILKMYTIETFFNSFTFSTTSKLLWLNYCKYLTYLFYLLYYVSASYHMMACFDNKCNFQYLQYLKRNNFSTPIGYLLFGGYSSIKSLCNFQRVKFNNYFHIYVLFLILALMYLFNVLVLAGTSACEAMKLYDVQSANEYMRRFKVAMHSFGLNSLYKRIARNIVKMYQFDGLPFIYGTKVYKYIPRDLFKIVRNSIFSEFMQTLPVFSMCDKNVLVHISSKLAVSIYEKHELIFTQGEYCTHMHIIIQGYCISYFGNERKIVGPGENLSGFEIFMQLPTSRTVYTETHCLLMSLAVEDLNQILLTYPNFQNPLRKAIDVTQLMKEELDIIKGESYTNFWHFTSVSDAEKVKHLIAFGGTQKAKYYGYFPKWLFHLRYLVIPYTITPYGNVAKYWEISRAFFALLNVILLPMNMTTNEQSQFWYIVFLLLDIAAWADICFRLHVAYFDERGIEICHPVKTVKHYLLNGFLLDFISVFPLDILGNRVLGEKFTRYYKCNRLLQIRRLFALLNHFSWFGGTMLNAVDTIRYLTIGLMICNLSAAFVFNLFCYYEETSDGIIFDCSDSSWLKYVGSKGDDKKLSPTTTYVYSLFFVTSLFANIYFPFIKTRPQIEKYILMCTSMCGYSFWMYVTANVVARNLTQNFDLVMYQDAMHTLVKFMSYKRIDTRLKNEVIAHFEYIWQKTRIVKIHSVMSTFPVPFQKSILFEVFGIRVMRSNIFCMGGEPVVRHLLLYAKHEMILKTGIVYSVNDVLGNVYLLYKGKVEVLGADESHLAFLSEGSLFGNLDNFPRTRQTVTMVASGHVELLVIDTQRFHVILSKYPDTYKHFMRRIAMNVDYVENDETEDLYEVKKTKMIRKRSAASIFENNIVFIWWQRLITAAAGISTFFEIYHIVTLDHSINFILILYFFDLLFVIKIILKFNTAFVDEFGILNRNKMMISQRYKRMGFYYDLVAVLPIEVLCIAFVQNRNLMIQVWSYFRANRLIRIGKSIAFFRRFKHRLNVNTYWVRTVFMFFNCILFITILASFLYFVDSYYRDEIGLDSLKKFRNFIDYWKVIMNMVMKMNTGYELVYFNTVSAASITFVLLMSKFISIYFVSGVIAMSQAINRSKHLFKIFAIKVAMLMEYDNISYPLLKLNIRYIASLWLHFNGVQSPTFLNEAPYYLKEGILNSMFGLHLRKHPIFKKCHVDLIRQISAKLKTRHFFPGDMITYVDDIDHCMYFIEYGEVHALTEDSLYNEAVEDILTSGNMFGFEQGIYLREGHHYTYKVTKNSFIVILQREDWIYLLDYFPASKLLLYDKTKEIHV